MNHDGESPEELRRRIHDLNIRLEEAEDTLRAIREGEVDGLVVSKGAETQVFTLKGADEAYRVLFETLNEGALTLGADGTIFYANTRFAAMVGLPLAKVLSTSLARFVAPADQPVLATLLVGGVQGSSKGEISLRAADGTLLPVLISLNAVQIEGAEGTCTAVLTDLSDLRAAREALEAVNAELEARVEARTAELVRANAELAAADRHKDNFLAMLAHELRNPLGTSSNAIQLLRRLGHHDPALERPLTILERQVVHQARMVDDLLDVSRITRGKISLEREWLDLGWLIRHAAEDQRAALESRGLRLTLDLPGEPVWVTADRTRLAQVLGNLLTNAAKFTDAGGLITLRLTAETEQDEAAVTVRDTGIGIAPEMLATIFQSFVQADHTLERSRGGLGLGLSLVKGLIELHGGRVRAESPGLGQGSAFTVILPLPTAPVVSCEKRLSAEAPGGVRRILLVEDNADAAETLRAVLELSGHAVETAPSGPAGVQGAQRFHPDVVLCDLGLPGFDGYQVARSLRADPATAGITLIALSGYGQEEDRLRSQEAGFDRHLVKPVNLIELEGLLLSTTGDAQGAR